MNEKSAGTATYNLDLCEQAGKENHQWWQDMKHQRILTYKGKPLKISNIKILTNLLNENKQAKVHKCQNWSQL